MVRASRTRRRRALRRWTRSWPSCVRRAYWARYSRKGVGHEGRQRRTEPGGQAPGGGAARCAGRGTDAAAGGRGPGGVAAAVLPARRPRRDRVDAGLRGAAAGPAGGRTNGIACVEEGERAAEEGAGPVPVAGAVDAADGGRAAAGPAREGDGKAPPAEANGTGDAAGRAVAGGSGASGRGGRPRRGHGVRIAAGPGHVPWPGGPSPIRRESVM